MGVLPVLSINLIHVRFLFITYLLHFFSHHLVWPSITLSLSSGETLHKAAEPNPVQHSSKRTHLINNGQNKQLERVSNLKGPAAASSWHLLIRKQSVHVWSAGACTCTPVRRSRHSADPAGPCFWRCVPAVEMKNQQLLWMSYGASRRECWQRGRSQ